ncbi:MAG TPA: thiolase domain-containing protein [Chloroflexota bacterium]|jgi:acetyl-CoA C-acetyltransferase|nr:thiolase domain-containing protein [Chloroflexota bacterium]
MSIRGKAYVVGAYEHPDRVIPDKTITQIHAEVAMGALKDAGLTLRDVDGYAMVGGDIGMPGASMADYLGLKVKYLDSTAVGGSSPVYHVGHAARAIAEGQCSIVLITLASKSKSGGVRASSSESPERGFEQVFGTSTIGMYALAATRHMYEYGTTSEQLAEIKVAAALHASYNPHALLQKRVTVEEVVNSRMLSDPLHLLDCCVVTDSGGAVIVASPEVARRINRPKVKILGQGESPKHTDNGHIDLTYTGARFSGPRAFDEAGVKPSDIKYVSIYDSFTITVMETIEDLGFCEKGQGGKFVLDGTLQAPHGKLPFNTDGGGLCNNHPGMGGMFKILEAVRQVRGEAAPEVQVPNCNIALAHGTGGSLGTRHASATLILGQEDA